MNTINFPNLEQAQQQAARWVAAMDRGLSEAEQVELNTWLEQSSINAEALVKYASMWDLLDVLNPISELLPMTASNESADKTEGFMVASMETPQRTVFSSRLAIACSLLMIVAGLVFYVKPLNHSNSTLASSDVLNKANNFASKHIYTTEIGEMSNVTLSDGSTIKLNTDSVVEVSFSKAQRQLTLKRGEVFFDVAKNPSRPFVVLAGQDKVTAVGTAFNVDLSQPLNTEVLVTEGTVLVNRSDNSYEDVYLSEGQKVVISDNESQITNSNDMDSILSWREGMLIFDGESLAHVIQEIDRYTPLTFVIADNEISSIPVGGFFKTGDLEQLILVLEQNFGVRSKRNGNRIVLSKF